MAINGMFDNLIEDYGAKLRPHIQTAAQRFDAYMWHIIARLDSIAEHTAPESMAEGRVRIMRALTAAGGATALEDIPMHQEWTLEVASVSAGTLTLSDGTGFVLLIAPGQVTPCVNFPKGAKVVATVSADAQVFLQFKVKSPQGGKDARTGFQNPDATGAGGVTDLPVYRHAAPGVGHVPITPSGDGAHGSGQGV